MKRYFLPGPTTNACIIISLTDLCFRFSPKELGGTHVSAHCDNGSSFRYCKLHGFKCGSNQMTGNIPKELHSIITLIALHLIGR